MAILADVKVILRIAPATTAFDGEIQDLIDACKMDLYESGIAQTKASDDTDILIKRAIMTYCKANFGWNNPDAERLQKSYDMLKTHLSLASDYNAEAVV